MTKISNLIKTVALAAATVAVAGIAQADDATAAKSRAEVTAELSAASAGGELGAFTGEDSGSFYLARQASVSGTSRQQVVAAAAEARDSGEAIAMVGEDSGSFYLGQTNGPSTRTRAEVAREVQIAKASGELSAMVGEDSGSEFLRHQIPEHWTRYAGPDIGKPASQAAQPGQAAA